jgi:diguanylate cyclase (GGDEF)-like protein/PAS domain S-box-containing protein
LARAGTRLTRSVRRDAFQPVGSRGTPVVAALLAVLALVIVSSVAVSVVATRRAENRAQLIKVAARQRTLVHRYVSEVLLLRQHEAASPATTALLLASSAHVLLDGGEVPEVPGDDDEETISAVTDPLARRQLEQEQRLIIDLTECGGDVLAWDRCDIVPTAGERLPVTDGMNRFRDLAALTSNVGLDATTTLTDDNDAQVRSLIELQVELGGAGLVGALGMGALIVVATRRQVAHFRSLVQSSNDLVVVLDEDGNAGYVSPSVTRLLGDDETDLLGDGFATRVHEDDRSVLLSAHESSERLLLRCRDASGAWRHLEATVTDLRADRHVGGVVLSCRDVSDRVDVERELAHAAFHDSLTGLANRALLQVRVAAALAPTGAASPSFALLLLDLDNFKNVNDSLGHPVGDELLTVVASRLAELVRPGDTVARLGGDEFCLFLANATAPVARRVASRVVRLLSRPVVVEGRELLVSASVGIALPRPEGPLTTADLLRQADLAMYAAKRAGPGRFEEYRPSMDATGALPMAQEAELRAAIARGQLVLHYQPERDIRTDAVVGVEALVRWDHPTLGLLGPAAFIPLAEATTAIVALGSHVLHAACRQAAEWDRQGRLPDGFVVWVNLSQRQLTERGLVDSVAGELRRSSLPASRLGVEVTETALVAGEADETRVRSNLERLQQLGVRIAIDDFGTGFSSLAHLRGLPADVIKIDRSFVAGVAHQPKDTAIVGNVINLAHALGLVTVAEGVETEEQLEAVRGMGCDIAQGYLLGPPCPADELAELLAGLAATGEVPEDVRCQVGGTPLAPPTRA